MLSFGCTASRWVCYQFSAGLRTAPKVFSPPARGITPHDRYVQRPGRWSLLINFQSPSSAASAVSVNMSFYSDRTWFWSHQSSFVLNEKRNRQEEEIQSKNELFPFPLIRPPPPIVSYCTIFFLLPSFVGWLCVISSHPRGNVIPHNSYQYPCDLSLLLLFLFFLLLPIINDYTLSSMGSGWASIDRWFSTKYLHRKMINQQETVKTVDPYRSIHPSPV